MNSDIRIIFFFNSVILFIRSQIHVCVRACAHVLFVLFFIFVCGYKINLIKFNDKVDNG